MARTFGRDVEGNIVENGLTQWKYRSESTDLTEFTDDVTIAQIRSAFGNGMIVLKTQTGPVIAYYKCGHPYNASENVEGDEAIPQERWAELADEVMHRLCPDCREHRVSQITDELETSEGLMPTGRTY